MIAGMKHCTILVRLVPRARVSKIVGERDGRLLVRVTAPPVGRANVALCAHAAAAGPVAALACASGLS